MQAVLLANDEGMVNSMVAVPSATLFTVAVRLRFVVPSLNSTAISSSAVRLEVMVPSLSATARVSALPPASIVAVTVIWFYRI